jgi:hypothetical protein
MVHKFFSGAKKPVDIAGFFMPAICWISGFEKAEEGSDLRELQVIKKANA